MTFTLAQVLQLLVSIGAAFATVAVIKNDIAWLKRLVDEHAANNAKGMSDLKALHAADTNSIKLDVRELRARIDHAATVVLDSRSIPKP